MDEASPALVAVPVVATLLGAGHDVLRSQWHVDGHHGAGFQSIVAVPPVPKLLLAVSSVPQSPDAVVSVPLNRYVTG
jgi:hypothetical protein